MKTKKFLRHAAIAVKALFEREKEPDEMILDFARAKAKILQANKEEIIQKKLMPVIRAEYLRTQGVLISDNQARFAAEQMFQAGKELGHIDAMNRRAEI